VPGGATYRAVASALLGQRLSPGMAESPELLPFRAALTAVLPGWGPSAPVAGTGGVDPVLLLAEGLRRLLVAHAAACGATAAVLVLEDLQWADPDTRALVGYLVAAARGSALLVVGSVRDDEAAPDVALSAVDGQTELRLGRLDEAAVDRLATAMTGTGPDPDVRAVVTRGEGLPALVEELLAGLAADPGRPDQVPPTMTALVGARLASLDAAAQRVVQAAAVLGAEPDWRLLAAMTGSDDDTVLVALRSAEEAGLVLPDPGRLRWRHALTRDAVLVTLLAPERAQLAGRAADALAEGGDDALRAELLVAAGDTVRAAALLRALARSDLGRGALRSAQDRLDRAVEIGAVAGDIVTDRVRVLALRGHVSEALEAGTAALTEVTGREHTELCRELARTAVAAGRWTDAERYLARAGGPEEPASAVVAAEAAFGQGRPEQARELAAAAEHSPDPEVRCSALIVSGRCSALSDLTASAHLFGRAAQLAAAHGLVQQRVEALIGLGTCELMQANSSAALAEARELAQSCGLLAHAVSIDVVRAEVAFTVAGPGFEEPDPFEIAERAGQLGLPGLQALAEILAAMCAATSDDPSPMGPLLAQAVGRQHVSPEVTAMVEAVHAMQHLHAGDLARADRLLDPAMTGLAGHASGAPLAFWGLWAVLRSVVGDGGEARDLLRGSPARLRSTNAGALAYADAEAAGRAGHRAQAEERFGAGDELLATALWWRRLLRLVVLDAAVSDGWGDPVPVLRADLEVFERAAEHQLARMCRDLLRRAGAPTRRGRGGTPVPPRLRAAGVTSREMDVLTLVGQGRSNAEIAQRLFLSPRTVETHVTNLLAKTGAASRGALRELLDR